jgi:hypothetical protein
MESGQQFTKMDRATAQEISKITQKALRDVFSAHGLDVTSDGGKFDDHTFTPKVTFAVAGGIEEKEREEFERAARLYGVQPSDYGRVFKYQGREYTLCGVRPRAGKYPFVGRDAAGNRMCFMSATVLRAFGG